MIARFAHVNKRLDLPLNSMLLTNSMVIIFGLIYLGASRYCIHTPLYPFSHSDAY